MIEKYKYDISPFDKENFKPLKELKYITGKRKVIFNNQPGKHIFLTKSRDKRLDISVHCCGSFNVEHHIFKRYKKKV